MCSWRFSELSSAAALFSGPSQGLGFIYTPVLLCGVIKSGSNRTWRFHTVSSVCR
ncbi:uncharacterized protein BO95DRAFT_203804 [Aspergillus brunneoviolaceus CBS 621.78]|uniref:Uncharacterized protein n=1 Tax=Aspergillus brunneoviolaceus CBS 621.78 TaxID=1450534 RepID=A0ACD1G3C4_9EURO|nr:hypothetical protein BO95DRAFT_203804 [Aspergillus brunneoviolaceus CBS 621.78]RAH43755.1 hypothetical protein BO95DRAFT_203804 [Aspergillus brunneoviolaceus CBS 621.78]